MGIETAIGMAALSAASTAASTAGSAGTADANAAMQQDIAKYQASVQRQDLYAERKDFKRDAASFMSRMRNYVGTSGASGTASATALRDSAAGEIGRTLGRFDIKKQRIDNNEQIELDSLAASREAIKQKAANMQRDNFLGFLGSSVGAYSDHMGDGGAMTDLSTGGKTLRSGTTSKPGGIGGF